MITSLLLLSWILSNVSALSSVPKGKNGNVVKTKSTKVDPPPVVLPIFAKAVQDWKVQFPALYAVGIGPTTKAERWNGRHAMFGWVALLATGYAKSHGLIPNPDEMLNVKEWGTLAYSYGGSITNERATILIGHLQLLLVSACAAIAPLSFQDPILLDAGTPHEPAAGLFPNHKPGLTLEAEILNGRLAMLGIIVLVIFSSVKQMPILDVISLGLGGVLF